MVLRLLEEGRQVDEILFCDTGLEFPQMYDHLEKLERYIGRPITRLKAPYTFEQYFYEYQAKGDATLVTNRGLSWPSHACRWCTGRLKTHVIAKYLRELKKQYQLVQYVGIAADEAHRCKDLHYPLVEWGMTEADCLNYCYAHGFDWGGRFAAVTRNVRIWRHRWNESVWIPPCIGRSARQQPPLIWMTTSCKLKSCKGYGRPVPSEISGAPCRKAEKGRRCAGGWRQI